MTNKQWDIFFNYVWGLNGITAVLGVLYCTIFLDIDDESWLWVFGISVMWGTILLQLLCIGNWIIDFWYWITGDFIGAIKTIGIIFLVLLGLVFLGYLGGGKNNSSYHDDGFDRWDRMVR
ncbi:MAG: hypothetical protein QGH25_21685 [Candidatus Latescibacteria bacterium]|nr:hypothetical protein [Candidatus Latescibacterota bacterium]